MKNFLLSSIIISLTIIILNISFNNSLVFAQKTNDTNDPDTSQQTTDQQKVGQQSIGHDKDNLENIKYTESIKAAKYKNNSKENFSFKTVIEEVTIPKKESNNISTNSETQSDPDVDEQIKQLQNQLTELMAGKIKNTTTDEESLQESVSEIITPEEDVEIVYKQSIVLNGKTLLYIGANNSVKSIARILDIKRAIQDEIYNAAKLKNYSLETTIQRYGNDYILMLDDKTILRVTDIDARVNNVSKERLSKIWKYNIDHLIEESIKTLKLQKPKETYLKVGMYLLITLLIILVLEFIRLNTRVFTENITVKFIQKLQKAFLELRNKKGWATPNVKEEVIQQQIDQIGNNTGVILSIAIKISQFIIVFIFLVVALYNLPQTYHYINQFTHYLISYCIVAFHSFKYWLISKDTWESLIGILFYIIETIIIIYLIKIVTSITISIIKVLFAGEIGKIKRFETMSLIISNTIQIIILVILTFLILMELGINLTPVIAGAGIAGIAFSFGAQSLIKDIINGIFILSENQFGIGDVIKVGDCSGVVEDMTLRITVIRDLSAIAHIIPNGQISQVSVYTKNWSRAHLDIGIAYKEDINTAIKLIKETADQMHKEFPEIIISEPRVLGVNNLGSSSVDIKLMMDTTAGEQWGIEREFRRRIKYVLDQNNIEIPFPHTTVYMPQNIGYARNESEQANIENYVETDFKTYDGKFETDIKETQDK
ncbi:MAG: mechanosensitive ion channel family protein [Cyanobacteriota bacterium]